ncbi:Sugar lactone lactonase YvrE [Clostridium grantii DSM 8605]|uniref:Sugar lactone lactonase YvrE n=2 Tax=Clostridium TaxID=1485 RepID=A0A1M5WNI9_9CLOT|nr:Sugar lactone lactonase YvrE [Clostridium grantii DSM 8605]
MVINNNDLIGECPTWNYNNNTFCWIDVEGKKVCSLDEEKKIYNEVTLDKRIGFISFDENNSTIMGLEDGVYIDNKLIYVPSTHQDFVRFNDGKISPAGNLWAGTMAIDQSEYRAKNAAYLYKFSENQKCTPLIKDVTISNGLEWSLDLKTFYYIDSPTNQIISYEYDIQDDTIKNPKIIIHFNDKNSVPDGMTIDDEGMLWVAKWGGYMVQRINPITGDIIDEIDLPTAQVTSCTFGGRNLDTLYITTASIGMNDEYAGAVFKVIPGVKGRKTFQMKNL